MSTFYRESGPIFVFFYITLAGRGVGGKDEASLAVFCSKVLFTKGREEGGRWLIVLFCSPPFPFLSPLIELGVLKEGKGLLLPREDCGCGGGKRDEKNTKSLSQTRWLFALSGAEKTAYSEMHPVPCDLPQRLFFCFGHDLFYWKCIYPTYLNWGEPKYQLSSTNHTNFTSYFSE